MAFAVGTIAAKDSASAAIGGGLLAGDVGGAGVGPFFLFHGLVDGKAGSNKLGVFAEDAAAADGDTGIQVLTRRTDTAAASATSDGDYQPFITDSAGRLHVNVGLLGGQVPAFGSGAAGATVLRVLHATDDPVVTGVTALAPAIANTNCTISNGTSLSAAVDLGAVKIVRKILVPASWTAANLTIQVSYDGGTTYGNLYDEFGNERVITAAASRVIELSSPLVARYLKLRSGTSGSAVNQGADRTLVIEAASV